MIEQIKFYVQAVLPTVYDDSLSYYELLNKVVQKTNEVIEQMNDYEERTSILEMQVDYLMSVVDGGGNIPQEEIRALKSEIIERKNRLSRQ